MCSQDNCSHLRFRSLAMSAAVVGCGAGKLTRRLALNSLRSGWCGAVGIGHAKLAGRVTMASPLFIKPGSMEQELKWAKIWFKQLSTFLGRDGWDSPRRTEFTAEQMIKFLKSKRDANFPAWKRMKIIRGLMVYRRLVLQKPVDDLEPVRKKM